MADYNEYLGELKKVQATLDQDRLYRAIKQRAAARPAPVFIRAVFPIAGAAAVLLVALALFYNMDIGAGSDTIASYLEEGEALNGSPLMTYVFGD